MSVHPDSRLLVRRFPRLAFKDAEPRVLAFIRRRAEHFGVGAVETVEDFETAIANTTEAFVIGVNAINPFTDFTVVESLIVRLQRTGARKAVATACVPGTQPEFVMQTSARNDTVVRTRIGTQAEFNNQVNLYKYKRLKMFLALESRYPGLAILSIPALMAFLEEQHPFLASYASGAELVSFAKCPYCHSPELRALVGQASQPLIGFVRESIPLYRQCEDCGLGFMSPAVNPRQTELIYDDFDYQDAATSEEELASSKLSTKLATAIGMLDGRLPDAGVRSLDLGGGSGVFSYHLKKSRPQWSVTHSDFDGRRQKFLTKAGVAVQKLNFILDEIGHRELDLVTAFEVIEHMDLDSFERLVTKVRASLRVGGFFLLTTPDFDSPLVRAFDFFNAYAPHHLLIFSTSWLKTYFGDSARGFSVVTSEVGGDLLDDYKSYFGYYRETAPTIQLQSSAELLLHLLDDPANRASLLDRGFGSEVILLLQRTA